VFTIDTNKLEKQNALNRKIFLSIACFVWITKSLSIFFFNKTKAVFRNLIILKQQKKMIQLINMSIASKIRIS